MKRIKMLAAAVLVTVLLMGVEIYIIRAATSYEPTTEVVFAKMKIPENTIVTADMLELRKVELGMVHKLSVRSPEVLDGKRTAVDIESGEMVLSSKVGSSDEMEKIRVKDKNKRLFSVEFKGDQANGWWLLTDQNVDILFIPSEDGNSVNSSSGIKKLKNIRVAALIDDRGKLLKNNERATLPRYISFEVTDEQASFLAYAKSRGRLELSVIPEE